MRYGKRSRLRIVIITVSVLLAVVLLAGGILFAVRQNTLANQIVTVEQVMNWSTTYWGDQSNLSGRVISDYVQELYPNSDTAISEIYVKEGDEVKIGDLLLQYDTTKLDINVESQELEVRKQQYELSEKQKELIKLQNTTPIEATPAPDDPDTPGEPGDPDDPDNPDDPDSPGSDSDGTWDDGRPMEPLGPVMPEVDPTPVPPPAELQRELNEHSRPFAGSGTSEDPFVFLCTKDCSMTAEFFMRVLGIAPEDHPTPTPTPSASPEASPTPESVPVPFVQWDGGTYYAPTPTPSPTPGLYTLPNGPLAVRLEIHKNNIETQPLTRGWVMDGWFLTGGFLSGVYGDMEDLIDDLKNGGGGSGGLGEGEGGEWGGMVEIGGEGSDEPQYTAEQLVEMIQNTKKEIRDLEVAVKQAEMDLRKAQLELKNASVTATVSGTVRTLTDIDSALFSGSPFLVVSGGTGFYLEGTLHEGLLDKINVGDILTASSWETGGTYEAQIVSISEYPSANTYYYDSSTNPNSSTYQFRAYIPESDDLRNNLWMDISLNTSSGDNAASDKLYLNQAYIRKDDNGRYVLKAGPDMRVHKEYVSTGRTIYDQYVEITGGDLSNSDYIAFPYGTNAVDGAKIDPEQDIHLEEEEATA